MIRLARTVILFLAVSTLSALGVEAARAAPAPPPETAPAPEGTGVVNLNTAGEPELTLLPGVGPSKAQAILAWRRKYGTFKKVDDLTKVKGFGRKTFLKLKPFLALSGPTTFKGKKAPAPPRPPMMEGP